MFDARLPGVTPPLAALLNEQLAAYVRAGCWPAVELAGELRLQLLRAAVRLGSADRYDKVFGLFSPQETRCFVGKGDGSVAVSVGRSTQVESDH